LIWAYTSQLEICTYLYNIFCWHVCDYV